MLGMIIAVGLLSAWRCEIFFFDLRGRQRSKNVPFPHQHCSKKRTSELLNVRVGTISLGSLQIVGPCKLEMQSHKYAEGAVHATRPPIQVLVEHAQTHNCLVENLFGEVR